MIKVEGRKGVNVEGYRINVQAEFTALCHELLFNCGFDQDDLLFAISLASISDDALLCDKDKTDEQLRQEFEAHPELKKILDDMMGAGYSERI